jgi:transposase-like protein
MTSPLPPDKDLKARYENDPQSSIARLASEYDVAHSTMYYRLQRAGVTFRHSGGRVTPPSPGLKARDERGATVRQLAEEHGLSYTAMHYRLRRAGVIFRARGGRRNTCTSQTPASTRRGPVSHDTKGQR